MTTDHVGNADRDRGPSMATAVAQIDVAVAPARAFALWADVRNLPSFMEGIESVKLLEDGALSWVGVIDGHRTEWQAEIVEQVQDTAFEWKTTSSHAGGRVEFTEIAPQRTRVSATIEWPDRQMVVNSLERFREIAESGP